MSLLSAYLNNPRTQRVLKRRKGEKGFSLIELVIVVAVLAVLAAIAVPAFTNLAEDGRKAAAKSVLASLYKECEVSRMQSGTAAHSAITLAVSGVTYSGVDVASGATTCTNVTTTATTTGSNVFTINLSTGAKTGSW